MENKDVLTRLETLSQVGDYVLTKVLGRGSFATVRRGNHIITNEFVAVKLIDKNAIEDDYLNKNLGREATLLRKIRHPNVIRTFEIIETDSLLCFVTELAKCNLLEVLCETGTRSEENTKVLLRQMAMAIDHMHNQNIVHRDLKAENIMLDHNGDVKIIDFGLACDTTGKSFLTTQCGSMAYTAPELLCRKAYDKSVDIWSLGVNIYVILVGQLPFPSDNLTELHALMLDGRFYIPDEFSDSLKDLLKHIFQIKPSNRISIEELLDHEWLQTKNEEPLKAESQRRRSSGTSIDVDENLVEEVMNLGFKDREEIIQSVLNNTCNSAMATYYLVHQKKIRELRDASSSLSQQLSSSPPATQSDSNNPPLSPAVRKSSESKSSKKSSKITKLRRPSTSGRGKGEKIVEKGHGLSRPKGISDRILMQEKRSDQNDRNSHNKVVETVKNSRSDVRMSLNKQFRYSDQKRPVSRSGDGGTTSSRLVDLSSHSRNSPHKKRPGSSQPRGNVRECNGIRRRNSTSSCKSPRNSTTSALPSSEKETDIYVGMLRKLLNTLQDNSIDPDDLTSAVSKIMGQALPIAPNSELEVIALRYGWQGEIFVISLDDCVQDMVHDIAALIRQHLKRYSFRKSGISKRSDRPLSSNSKREMKNKNTVNNRRRSMSCNTDYPTPLLKERTQTKSISRSGSFSTDETAEARIRRFRMMVSEGMEPIDKSELKSEIKQGKALRKPVSQEFHSHMIEVLERAGRERKESMSDNSQVSIGSPRSPPVLPPVRSFRNSSPPDIFEKDIDIGFEGRKSSLSSSSGDSPPLGGGFSSDKFNLKL
eukprot:UC4_evm8s704